MVVVVVQWHQSVPSASQCTFSTNWTHSTGRFGTGSARLKNSTAAAVYWHLSTSIFPSLAWVSVCIVATLLSSDDDEWVSSLTNNSKKWKNSEQRFEKPYGGAQEKPFCCAVCNTVGYQHQHQQQHFNELKRVWVPEASQHIHTLQSLANRKLDKLTLLLQKREKR